MTEELQNPDLKDSARRKLVRGAFAAPAVLTLHSGSAIAASSAATCLVRANASPTTVGPVANPTDGYFRYQLYVLRDSDGRTQSHWINGADLRPFKRMGQTPFVPKGSWREFNPGTNFLVGTNTTTSPLQTSNWTLQQDGGYVSLRVNATGALVGAGGSGSGSACSGSCWTSFAAKTV